MSAVELLAGYRAGRFSPVEATGAVLDRIHAVNDKINAFMIIDDEGALAAAKASEDRWAKGAPMGLLDGVPTTLKDLVLTKGWPTLKGSLTVDPAGPWDEDAPCVARLREH
ncbi:MAG: amidase, partial [Rhodospirillaceae bacterium]|nr:amidase [Rhodospirillaceae bacterium]